MGGSALITNGLIDEFHPFINPVMLGQGVPIFQEITSMQEQDLIQSIPIDCGIPLVVYKPA